MKILVTLPDSYKESEIKNLINAIEHLRKLGHNVFSDYDLRKKWLGEKKSDEAHAKYFNEVEKLIKDTDILLTDVTLADLKIGYEIARALDEKKIVIALENEGDTTKKHSKYTQLKNQRTLILKSYKDSNLAEVIDKTLNEAKSKMDTKFILIISPEIDRYLDWAGQTKRMHKAQIVRNAIESTMNKDREYKNYLNN
jgi:hypothetical protein